MKLLAWAVATAMGLAGVAGGASAQTANHIYELNGSLADSLGGPALTLRNGATLGATGVTFGPALHSGLRLSNALGAFTSGAVYSVELYFSFEQVGGYRRVINTNGDDNGAYVYNGFVDYYEGGPISGGTAIAARDPIHYVLTRDADRTTLYQNGSVALFAPGDLASSLITSDMLFFIDEASEESGGFVDFIRTYDSRLSDTQVAQRFAAVSASAGAVPEPAAWAMLLVGFGAIGGAMRRHQRRSEARFARHIARIAAGEAA